MTTIQMLSVRTNAALSRLASLQRRAERIAMPAATVVRPALRELTDALEELQVANDQLQAQIAELTQMKAAAYTADRRFAELLQVLPCAAVWTTHTGEITDANPAAALLLNVSRQHLAGRPLLLFMAERSGFQDALAQLAAATSGSIDLEGEVRPRERRGRRVNILGRRLDGADNLCWFLLESKPYERPV
jgi:PAS domain-containing protein